MATRKKSSKKSTKKKVVKKKAVKKKAVKKVKSKKKTSVKKAKKKVVKKVAKKKKTTSVKKKSAPVKLSSNKPPTVSDQLKYLAYHTGLTKKDVSSVFEHMIKLIKTSLSGPGKISLGGLLQVKLVRKPATKARKGINPFTGEPTIFKAKPARNVVKIRPLKKLKDAVEKR